jgi:LysM repeat protein
MSDFIYTVKSGDTLSKIAAAITLDPSYWRAISNYNNLDDPNLLQVGQQLSMPVEWVQAQFLQRPAAGAVQAPFQYPSNLPAAIQPRQMIPQTSQGFFSSQNMPVIIGIGVAIVVLMLVMKG